MTNAERKTNAELLASLLKWMDDPHDIAETYLQLNMDQSFLCRADSEKDGAFLAKDHIRSILADLATVTQQRDALLAAANEVAETAHSGEYRDFDFAMKELRAAISLCEAGKGGGNG